MVQVGSLFGRWKHRQDSGEVRLGREGHVIPLGKFRITVQTIHLRVTGGFFFFFKVYLSVPGLAVAKGIFMPFAVCGILLPDKGSNPVQFSRSVMSDSL